MNIFRAEERRYSPLLLTVAENEGGSHNQPQFEIRSSLTVVHRLVEFKVDASDHRPLWYATG